jgi:hypothetical protein
MRQGKKPTLKQKKLLNEWRMNPEDWLVLEDTPTELKVAYRFSDRTVKVLPKG